MANPAASSLALLIREPEATFSKVDVIALLCLLRILMPIRLDRLELIELFMVVIYQMSDEVIQI